MTDQVMFLGVPFKYFQTLLFGSAAVYGLSNHLIITSVLVFVAYVYGVVATRKDQRWWNILTVNARFVGRDIRKYKVFLGNARYDV